MRSPLVVRFFAVAGSVILVILLAAMTPVEPPPHPGPRPIRPAVAVAHAPAPVRTPAMLVRRGGEVGEDEEESKGDTPESRARALATVQAMESSARLGTNTTLGEWRNIGPGTLGGKSYAVAVNPLDPANVMAAYETGGLWRTRDGGDRWTPMFDFFRDQSYASVQFHPTVNGVVAAGLIGKGRGYGTSQNLDWGVVYSQDGGDTWNTIGPRAMSATCKSRLGTLRPTVWDIAFDPADANVVYAATDCGLYKTIDGGANWAIVLGYAPADPLDVGGFKPAVSFRMHPANSQVLLLATNAKGVMRSPDGGATWTRVDTTVSPPAVQLPRSSPILAWSSADPQIVYLQLYVEGADPGRIVTYKSVDAGQTWAATVKSTQFHQGRYDMSMAVDPADSQRVLIANTYHFISENGLSTLSSAPSGGQGPDSLGLTFDPNYPNVVYNANDEGVFRSDDRGATWRVFDRGALTNRAVGTAVAPNGDIYTNSADYGTRIAYTSIFGWRIVRGGYEYNYAHVNPSNASEVYDMGSSLHRVGNGLDSADVEIEPDPGVRRNYRAVAFAPGDPNDLYVATSSVWKSTDRGAHWTKLGIDATVEGLGAMKDIEVAANFTGSRQIYVISGEVDGMGTLWSSDDDGETWHPGASFPYANAIAINPQDPTQGLIATQYNGLYSFSNSGASSAKATGFPDPAPPVQDVIFHPANSGLRFAATSNGVLVKTAGSPDWKRLGTRMPPQSVGKLQLVGSTLYASTFGAAIWAMDVNAGPGCNQPMSTVPVRTSMGSYAGYNRQRIEVFAVDGCPWTAAADDAWVHFDTGAVPTTGHGVVFAQADDWAGPKTRNTTLTVAGQRIPFYQFGNQTHMKNSAGCLSVSDAGTLSVAACKPADNHQKFWNFENYVGGFSVGPTFANQCLSVPLYYGPDFPIEVQACDYSLQEQSFKLYQVTPGSWWLVTVNDYCLDTAGGVVTQQVCKASSGTQKFKIE